MRDYEGKGQAEPALWHEVQTTERAIGLSELADHLLGHALELVRQVSEIDRRVFGAPSKGEGGAQGLNHADPAARPSYPVQPMLQNVLGLLIDANGRAAKLVDRL